jgi:hypothetical protein
MTHIQIIGIWTSIIGALSLINKYGLGKLAPKVARFVSAIISIPSGHLANFIEDIEQLVADIRGGGTPPSPPPVAPPASPPGPPVAMRVGLATLLGFGLIACGTPAQQAVEAKVEQTVLADIVAGKTLQQIEADVAQLVAGQPGADAVIITNDILAFLVDIGVIPPNVLPQAKAMLVEVQPVAVAHRAAAK